MNLYAYVNNNPLNWTDPWGLCKITDSDLRNEMNRFHKEKSLDKRRVPYMEADTKFHKQKGYYIYKGKRYHSSEVNYIGIGMAIARDSLDYWISPLIICHGFNYFAYGHFATEGEMFFARYGYRYYQEEYVKPEKMNIGP